MMCTWSCNSCRRRHTKCDNKRPCGACTRLGYECIYPITNLKPKNKRTTQKALKEKIKYLEVAISEQKVKQANLLELLYASGNTSNLALTGIKRKRNFTTDAKLGHSFDIKANISMYRRFVGAKYPQCMLPPISYEDFFEGKATSKNLRMFAMLAVQQLYCKNTSRARDFATKAVALQNTLLHKPSVDTAISSMILAAYFAGSGYDTQRGIRLVELADDTLEYIDQARQLKVGHRGLGRNATKDYVKVLRALLSQYKYARRSQEYRVERELAKNTLIRINKGIKSDMGSSTNTLTLQLTLEALANIQANQWNQTGVEKHKNEAIKLMRECVAVCEMMPEQPYAQVYCNTAAARVFALVGCEEEALEAADRVKQGLPLFQNSLGVFPYIGFGLVDTWNTYNQYGRTEDAAIVFKYIKQLSEIYHVIKYRLEMVSNHGTTTPPARPAEQLFTKLFLERKVEL